MLPKKQSRLSFGMSDHHNPPCSTEQHHQSGKRANHSRQDSKSRSAISGQSKTPSSRCQIAVSQFYVPDCRESRRKRHRGLQVVNIIELAVFVSAGSGEPEDMESCRDNGPTEPFGSVSNELSDLFKPAWV
jgi:hypothetical protein